MDIKEIAKFILDKYQTNDPFKIAKSLGIIVVYENLGNTLGYYSKSNRFKVIHINENSPRERQLFTCAHELGHAILHPDANTPFLKKHTLFSTDKIEVEANTFAVELLFRKAAEGDVITIYEAIEEFGIPKQLAILKSLFK